MYRVTKYPHGTFSWADCASTNYPAAKQFYVDLMGWDTEDLPMGDGMFYTMFVKDGVHVAGISQMMPDQQAQGMPSVWNSYVTVDDVEVMPDKVRALGGTVIADPFDVFDSGRMMVLQDPTGAFVSLWQPKNHIGAGLVNVAGAMSWNELQTRDVQKASAFFEPLLGWTIQKNEDQEYYNILNNGRLNGGILPMSEEWGDMPSHWMVYFAVESIDETVAKVRTLGGSIHVPATDAPGVGRFAIVADPAGAASTLIQLDQPQPWTA